MDSQMPLQRSEKQEINFDVSICIKMKKFRTYAHTQMYRHTHTPTHNSNMINLLNCNNETLTPARQAGEAGRRRFRPDVPEGVGSHLVLLDQSTMFAPQKHVERRTESEEMLLFSRMLYIGHYHRHMKKPCVSDHNHCRGACLGKLHRFHHR